MMFVRHGPLWFRLSTVLLIVWGLAGCFACAQQFRLGAEAMGPATEWQRALYAGLPRWYNPMYAIAVGTGLVGAVLLFLRKRAALAFFIVSLVAVIAQFGWLYVNTDIVAHEGPASAFSFPLLIVAIALYAIWLSGHARARGWIR